MIQNKKFAIILGDGPDGAGVSRAAIEQYKWCNKNGIFVEVFYYDTGKKYVERQFLKMTRIAEDCLEFTDYINNNFDVAIFHSFPRKDANYKMFSDFYNFIHNLKCIKIAIDHNTTQTSMNAVSQVLLMFNEMDKVFMFEAYSGFGKTIQKLLPSKQIGYRLKKTHLWFNFETFNKYYDTHYENRHARIVYAGRYASFKHTEHTLYLGKAIFDLDKTIKVEMHGITAGIAAKVMVFDNPYAIREKYEEKAGPDACVNVYGPYVHSEMMDYLSHSLFGNSFFDYESNQKMEFAQLEMIACGCVPIFDLNWAKTLRLNSFGGKTYFEVANGNGLFVDRNNITKKDAQKIIDIASNPILWELFRKTAFDIVSLEYGADKILLEQFTEFVNTSKDNNRFIDVNSLLKYNLGVDVDDLITQYKDDIIVINPSQINKKNFTILQSKKLKLVQHYK